MDEEEVIINIDEDPVDSNDPVADLKSQFATLQENLKAEKERSEAAERRATAAAQDAARERQNAQAAFSRASEGEAAAVESGIARTKAEAESAKADLKAAYETGDTNKLADAQERIARAQALLVRFDEGKADIEARRAAPRQAPPPRAPVDPVERLIAEGNMDQRSADWMRRNREHVVDPLKMAKVRAAHYDAEAAGIEPNSPEYFEHVENFVGFNKQDAKPNGKAEPAKRRSAPPVAPVNGGSGNPPPRLGAGTTVTLRRDQIVAAENHLVWNPGEMDLITGKRLAANDPRIGQPIGQQQYARRIAQMQREGRFNPNGNVEQ